MNTFVNGKKFCVIPRILLDNALIASFEDKISFFNELLSELC